MAQATRQTPAGGCPSRGLAEPHGRLSRPALIFVIGLGACALGLVVGALSMGQGHGQSAGPTLASDRYLVRFAPSGTLVPTVTVTGQGGATTGPVSYSVTVTGSGGTPTGSVGVSDGNGGSCSIATLDGTGSGSCSIVENATNSPFTVTATYSGDGSYAGASGTTTETVGLATPSVTLSGQSGGPANTTDYAVTVSGPGATPTGSVTITDSNGDACTTPSLDSSGRGACSILDNNTNTPYTVSAGYGGDLDYTTATGVPTPVVTVTDDSSGVVTGGSFDFTATVSGPGQGAVTPTGKISWVLTGPGSPTCADSTLSGGIAACTVSQVVPGTYGASATYSPASTDYTVSSGSDITASVGPATLTITASSGSMTYGGTPPAITAGYAGFENGDTPASLTTMPTCSTTATGASPVGGYTSSCSGAVDPDYSISYVSGTVSVTPATLTITASSGSMTYGGTPPAITAGYSGFENGDTPASLTTKPRCSTAATSSSPVGGYTSSCSGAAGSNYTIGYLNGTVNVGRAALTVTASGGSMTYGGSPPAITAGYSGFENGDSPASLTTKPRCSTTATGSSPVGGYTSSCSGAAGSNYTIGYLNGTVTVDKAALSVTASGGSMTYGGAPPAIAAGYSGFVNGDTSGSLTTKPTCSTTATSSSPVGSYTSSCSGASDPNYKIGYLPGSVTVKEAALTITALHNSFPYGGTPPTITAGYSGFVNGDGSASLATQPACSTVATSSSTVGSYASSCSGASDPNYAITYVAGTVAVVQATPTVTVSGQTGQTTGPVAVTATVSGPAGVDVPTGSVSVTDPTGLYSCSIALDPTTGSGSCSLIENASDDGGKVTATYEGDSNYTVTSGTTLENVAKATPTVSVSPPSEAINGSIFYVVTVSGPGESATGNVVISDGTNTCTTTVSQGGCGLAENTGTYQIEATYEGDGDYLSASSTTAEVVNETVTSLALSKSALTYGGEQGESFTATVTWPPGAPVPTGTVLVVAGRRTLCVTSPLQLTYVEVDGVPSPITTGACALTAKQASEIGAGTYMVAAEYQPAKGIELVGSTSPAAPLTVSAAPTSTTLSLSSGKTSYGSENGETLRTAVSGPAGLSFVTGGVTISAASKVLCVVRLKKGTGGCALSRAQLAIGRHLIVADYAGSTNLVTSRSTSRMLLVARASTSTSLSMSRSRSRTVPSTARGSRCGWLSRLS